MAKVNFEEAQAKLWEIAIWFAGGYLLGWIALILLRSVEILGLILGLVALVVISYPSTKVVRRNGFGGIFSESAYVETTYASGKKETSFDGAGTFALIAFKYIAIVLLGIVITPIRLIVYMFKFNKLQKEAGITKPPFKESMWLPPAAAAGAFVAITVIGIIIMNIMN